MVQSDGEIVKTVLNGDKEVFGILVRRCERPVRAIALDVVGDHSSAADVSQEAFVKAYRELPGLREAGAFGPWLMRIARRCALDVTRRRLREFRSDAKIAAAIGASEARIARAIGSSDGRLDVEKATLLAAVVKLPRAEEQVVMLRYFSGHSVRAVAQIAGRSVGTVTKQLSRAHKRLRNMLSEMEAEK